MKAPVRHQPAGTQKWHSPPDKEWLEEQLRTRSGSDIARAVGTSRQTVSTWIRRTGARRPREQDPPKDLRELYQAANHSLARLAGELHVTTATIKAWLDVSGIEIVKKYRSPLSARRLLHESEAPFRCAWCGAQHNPDGKNADKLQAHHRDHDHHNNDLENLMWLCFYCHKAETWLWTLEKRGKIRITSRGTDIIMISLNQLKEPPVEDLSKREFTITLTRKEAYTLRELNYRLTRIDGNE